MQHAIDIHVLIPILHLDLAFAKQGYDLRMEHLLILPELLYKFLNAGAVIKALRLILHALVRKHDFDAWIQERQFAEPVCQDLKFKLGGDREDGRIGLKGDQCAGAL